MLITEKKLRKLVREVLLNEGVYDPGILKAVFMAGGPGSGKSYTAKIIFGGDPKSSVAASTATGLKLVNSDPAFEHFLKKAGIDPGELGKMSKEEFEKVTVGSESPRGKAKKLRNKAQTQYMQGRLGLVIDGTGDDYKKTAAKKAALEKAGYDTFMIFVNTSLDVAQERNAQRDRKLPEDLVEEIWSSVQQNLGGFQSLFGAENLAIVDNTVYGPLPKEISAAARNFMSRPVKNRAGKAWIEQELKAKGPKATLPKRSGAFRG